MFRFWSSESRGSEQLAAAVQQPMPHIFAKDLLDTDVPVTSSVSTSVHTLKRKAQSLEDTAPDTTQIRPHVKRARIEHTVATPPETPAAVHKDYFSPRVPQVTTDVERAKEAIQYQFGLEILLKHDELRLINQELAKCQVALEQLRRCHLIPYPVSCPTPQQMSDISSGKGPAVQANPGEAVPKWAAPFGVVEGPYARHYAKWLIPDPVFDGVQADWQAMPDMGKRNAMEGRTTRNSLSDPVVVGKRAGRGLSGQKLQALSNGYPQPKEKAGPCVLKRSDGQTVKLVCIDCQRENFSSTQGFINHCRIAHRRDFKSHEEAAVHCGHPIEVDEIGGVVGEEKPTASPASGLVHPLARNNAADEKEVYATLRSRIAASLKLYEQGKLPGVTQIPGVPSSSPKAKVDKKLPKSFVGASDTPYLSKLMQKRSFNGNLSEHVEDAKTKMDLDDLFSPGEDSDSELPSSADVTRSPSAIPAARTPAVMRIPARMSSPPPAATARPSSSKGRSPHLAFATKSSPDSATTPVDRGDESPRYDEMDVDLSPNTMASNNAPSLVSDDGEYDDSDDGTSSETSENMETESVSDVAEITLDEDPEAHETARHHRGSTSTAVKLKKEESKHVTFVSPVRGNPKGRPRKQKA